MARFTRRGLFGGEKVVELDLDGEHVVTREGSAGKPLREKRFHVPSAVDRAAYYASQCDERRKRGWTQVEPLFPKVRAENARLEAAALDSPEAALVFSDFLHERGDPWGELISLASARGERAFTTRELDLRDAVLPRFLLDPALLARARSRVEWRQGLPSALVVGDDPDQAALEALGRSRLAGVVERVHLGLDTDAFPATTDAQLTWLLSAQRPRVRELFLGDSRYQLSWTEVPALPTPEALPALERLRVRGTSCALAPLRLPGLTHFALETGGLAAQNLMAIAEAPWPRLTHLEVWFGDQNYGLSCTPDQVAECLTTLHAPALAHLGLRNCPFAHELVPRLARSSLVSQLRALDLSMGGLQPDDVPALLEHRAAFAHLELLDLSDNMLGTERGPERRGRPLPASHLGLDALGPQVVVGPQRAWDEVDGERFASATE